ncbi:MAG: DUF305 domain-containing protein [Armatimonadota bacterium]
MRSKYLLLTMVLCLMSSMAWGEECQTGPRPPGTDLRSLSGLQSLSGSKFEIQYMKLMYQLHSDTQALAETELKSTMDVGLRQLSNNISHEQYDLNKKLETWYSRMTGTRISDYCINSNAEFQQLQQTSWRNFDTVYADIMLDYLQRAKDASALLLSKSRNADLRNQAGIVIKTSDREIAALKRWQNNQPMFD